MKYSYYMQDTLYSWKMFLLVSSCLCGGYSSLLLASPAVICSFKWCFPTLDSAPSDAKAFLGNLIHCYRAVISSSITHVSSFSKHDGLLIGHLFLTPALIPSGFSQ